jgi:hypothetical protein
MRSISRVCDVSINTVSKLLIDAGKACASFHDANVRDVNPAAFRSMKSGPSLRRRPVAYSEQSDAAEKI